MSTVNNGPQIVRNGLVLNLDASSVTSYSAISVYKVECYSTFGGGLRSANYTVQYSDDNSTWTTAFTGVMSNNSSCGIIAGTNRNDSNYSKHRYWRYVEGGAVVGHHPRVSRIDFITKSGAVYNLITYTTDNCADSGTYIVGAVSKDFGTTTWRDTSGNSNNGTFGASTAEPTYSNQNGGSLVFDGSNDYISITNNSTLRPTSELTIEYIIKGTTPSGWCPIIGYGNGDYTNGNYLCWVETGGALNSLCRINNGGVIEYRQYSGIGISTTTLKYMSFTMRIGDSIKSYYNGVNTNTPTNLPAGGSFYYGGTSSPYQIVGLGGAWLNGSILFFRLYNRALTAAEVSQNYEATKTRFGL